jgi:transposase
MGKTTIIGVDLAKSSFQIHEASVTGKVLGVKKLPRSKFPNYLGKLPKATIYMEACGSANFWARKAQSYGHEVRLIAPQYVKPFVKRHKTDAADAAAIVEASIGNATDFQNARQLAAWVGLTPRQHSTGGKQRILGISKAGNRSLRTLLIHGGRAVLMNAGKKKDSRSKWAVELKERVGMNKAAVAMAHKNIRTVYALLKHGSEYDENFKPNLPARKRAG